MLAVSSEWIDTSRLGYRCCVRSCPKRCARAGFGARPLGATNVDHEGIQVDVKAFDKVNGACLPMASSGRTRRAADAGLHTEGGRGGSAALCRRLRCVPSPVLWLPWKNVDSNKSNNVWLTSAGSPPCKLTPNHVGMHALLIIMPRHLDPSSKLQVHTCMLVYSFRHQQHKLDLHSALQVAGIEGLVQSSPADWQVLKPSSDLVIDEGYLSEPSSIEFPTEGGLTAYMNYYPPKNKDYAFPAGELPALVR